MESSSSKMNNGSILFTTITLFEPKWIQLSEINNFFWMWMRRWALFHNQQHNQEEQQLWGKGGMLDTNTVVSVEGKRWLKWFWSRRDLCTSVIVISTLLFNLSQFTFLPWKPGTRFYLNSGMGTPQDSWFLLEYNESTNTVSGQIQLHNKWPKIIWRMFCDIWEAKNLVYLF